MVVEVASGLRQSRHCLNWNKNINKEGKWGKRREGEGEKGKGRGEEGKGRRRRKGEGRITLRGHHHQDKEKLWVHLACCLVAFSYPLSSFLTL